MDSISLLLLSNSSILFKKTTSSSQIATFNLYPFPTKMTYVTNLNYTFVSLYSQQKNSRNCGSFHLSNLMENNTIGFCYLHLFPIHNNEIFL